MKGHRISNTFARLSVCGLLCIGLLACSSPKSSEQPQDTEELGKEVLKPLVEIRNEALARLARQFTAIALPHDTRGDSVAPSVSPLRDADLRAFLRKGSTFEGVYQCYPMYRLPDYGDFVALIYANLQQESGGLRLLLVTYTPEGRPIDELLLKDDSDTGSEYTTLNTRIAADFTLEQTVLQVLYEQKGEEETVEKDRKEQLRRYGITPEGKIKRQP